MEMFGVLILLISGIYFSIKLRFKHLNMIRALKIIGRKEDGISSFQSLCISLASRIGVGSLSGVILSIYVGGIGSIFWMWIITLICSSNTMIESMLSVKYRNGSNEGGPFYYMNIFSNKMAFLYALVFIVAYIGGFLTIQSNTIAKVVSINPIITGLLIVLFTSLIIFKGLKGIANTVSKIVPFVAIIYIISCLLIIFKNIDMISNIIISIVKNAFNIKSFIVGSTKAIFSTEAGIGTGAIASATSSNNNPSEQGLVQVFGIFFDTFVVSTLTAFVVILSPIIDLNINSLNGIELTRYAFIYHLSSVGSLILITSIILFAYSTIISGYYYLEVAIKFITKKENMFNLKLITITLLFISTIISPSFIWEYIDIFVSILAIINTISLIILRKKVFNDKI
ncbi:MAG: amino acid carrier protein [Bacilli bacterium]|nr:amino acid carrier protein [Bacilli bacterium]